MSRRSIKNFPWDGKKAFVRTDFNVPLTAEGLILDDSRIKESLPTLNYLLSQGASLVLASHLGRPGGKTVESLRLNPVAQRLEKYLEKRVCKLDKVAGNEVEQRARSLPGGGVLLLENVRFHPGEEENDPELARFFASLADVFVNDAFGTAHRSHASTVGVGQYIPAFPGLLMEKELEYLDKCINNPPRPLVALMGGKKVSDKIGVIKTLLKTVDHLLIGGAMANTFWAARGYKMGRSLVEEDKLDLARNIWDESLRKNVDLVLPKDFIVAGKLASTAETRVVPAEKVPPGMMALDIGPETIAAFSMLIEKAGLLIWNGPLGAFETKPFHKGTTAVGSAVAKSRAISVVGGGDTIAALKEAGLAPYITHLSTGGGALLEYWEGKTLPAVALFYTVTEPVAKH